MEESRLYFEDFPRAREVFRYFEEISEIPRASGNTAGMVQYLLRFAKERGLSARADDFGNVVIKKPASPGREGRPTVVLQGHTDMVAAKAPGVTLDMDRDPLVLRREGDFLRAEGTTLGGDDGIAVAYMLALLADRELSLPALEAVFTADEEIGLLGATGLDTGDLRGRLMINLDSDDEGVFTVGCAGGLRADLTLPVTFGAGGEGVRLRIHGLCGGHSGTEIDKGHANAIKLMGELLSAWKDIRLGALCGGEADNAIPRECTAVVLGADDAEAAVADFLARARATYGETEAQMQITVEPARVARVADAGSTAKIVGLLRAVPDGVIAHSRDIPGLVQTSLNLGMISLGEEGLSLVHSVRSSVEQEKRALTERLEDTVRSFGGGFCTRGEYPAWEYRKDSPLQQVMCRVYREMYGKEPRVMTIHAGLECGIFAGKMAGLDCVSMGPDNFDIHTPKEHLSLSSAARVWDYLTRVLGGI